MISSSTTKKKVYLIMPITIPGMNKEVFYKQLQIAVESKGFKFSALFNKAIKREFKDRMLRENPWIKDSTLKSATDKKTREKFRLDLDYLINLEQGLPPSRVHFIYMGKNHPPEAISSTLEFIGRRTLNVDLKVIALVPRNSGERLSDYAGQKFHNYPFSPRLFFSCVERVQKREFHETLKGDGLESFAVELMFLQLFRDQCLEPRILMRYSFHKTLEISFTPEEIRAEPVPQELIVALRKAIHVDPVEKSEEEKLAAQEKRKNDGKLKGFRVGNSQNMIAAEEFFAVYEKHKQYFKLVEPNADTIRYEIEEYLENEVLPEIDPDYLLKKMENLRIKEEKTHVIDSSDSSESSEKSLISKEVDSYSSGDAGVYGYFDGSHNSSKALSEVSSDD